MKHFCEMLLGSYLRIKHVCINRTFIIAPLEPMSDSIPTFHAVYAGKLKMALRPTLDPIQTSFPVIHKVDNIGIFVQLRM